MEKRFTVLIFAMTIGTTCAFAQASPTAKPALDKGAKTALSKSCSDQADAKSLHGKERKKFRSSCKRMGAKTTN